ncbi:hypothetical protein [Halococcus sp. PRR34]|uniref:hypothetical protein n=1 Tax=Halococcus sp. PRR34 TaxID=3020830 RepID=UPI00235FF216|nr:hypothetical protein [Halococcus sp. PRR34]
MAERYRLRLLAALVVVVSASSGCLALDPRVSLDTADSAVFESASTSGSWAAGQVATNVTFTSNATTSAGVTRLNVIADGQTFDTAVLDSGQSSATILLPTNGTATVVAANTVNGTTVETRNATITGESVV